jgi:hypothetical protein
MDNLTDLEICKRIAEIEDYTTKVDRDGFVCATNNKLIGLHAHTKGGYYPNYNPLTDDALCFQLMVKYEVCICHYGSIAFIQSDYTDKPNKSQCSFDGKDDLNKAICLAIIEAHKDVTN